MINVTSAFSRALNNDNRDYREVIEITLRNGVTLTLTDEHIWGGTFKIDDAVSSDNELQLGSAIVNRFDFTINNLYDDFSSYDFYGARVVVKVALLTDVALETIKKGTYVIAEDPVYNGDLIKVTCYDYMYFFDVSYSSSMTSYPATADTIIRNACTDLGITLATNTFPNRLLTVAAPPDKETTTYREVVAYVAQMCGCYARCNRNGELELKWFDRTELESVMDNLLDGGIFDDSTPYATGDTADGGSFNPWNTGTVFDAGGFSWSTSCHYISSLYSHDISVEDVVITGVRILVKTESNGAADSIKTYSQGMSNYVIEIKDNPFITETNVNTILGILAQQLIGLTYRRANITHGSDPSIEAGDIAILWDRKQNVYPILITHTTFTVGSSQSTISAAQTPVRNGTSRFNVETKNYVEFRKRIQNERTAREAAEAQLAQNIANATGLYVTQQTDQTGATITYLHNKSNLAESDVRIMFSSVGITVTPDGGSHWYGLQVDGQLIASILTTTGINADWIDAGTLVIRDGQGNVTFSADTQTGVVRIVADQFSLSNGDTLQSVATAAVNSANSYTNTQLSNYQATVDALIGDIQDQLDGVVDTYYYSYAPTTSNIPAYDWVHDGTEEDHEGDLFLDTSTGKSYRWVHDNNVWQWKEIPDTASAQALQAAQNAYDLADHKRRIFVAQPTPPYDVGDLWAQGANGDILRCATARTSGASYVEADWVKASRYTDDSALNSFLLGDYASDLQAIQGQFDQQVNTYYQASDPSLNWSSAEKNNHISDLWYDSSSTGQKCYRWNGFTWDEMTATPPDAVFDQIDGKATIFVSQPTTPYRVGDLWVVASTDTNIPTGGTVGDIMTCMTQRLTGQYNSADWVKKNKYTDDSALTTFRNSVYDPRITSLEAVLDGKIDTYFYNYAPSLSNVPAMNWSTTALKDEHLDDLFYNTSTGYCYRFTKSGTTYSWQRVKDTDITSAMNAASAAQDTADHKRRVFTEQPDPPYDKGDIWTQGANGDIMVCIYALGRTASESYVASDWTNASKSLTSWINGAYANDLNAIRGQMDRKADTWYQDEDPSETEDWDSTEMADHIGDLWYCTAITGAYAQKYFSWNGESWDEFTATPPEEVVTAINGKAKIFVSQPVPPYKIGDLWVQGSTGDILKCVNAKTESGTYAQSDWAKASKYTDDSGLQAWIAGDFATTINSVRGQIDQKAETFYGDAAPSEDWTQDEYTEHIGDLWYCTATTSLAYRQNQTYRWNGSTWVAQDVPMYVFDEINGKAQIFVSQPTTPYYIGDLWVQGSTGDIMRCVSGRATGNYTASDWTKASKYTDDTLVKTQYGKCTTVEATTRKFVSCPGFVLYPGARIMVSFSYGNTAASPKLDVNNTGEKDIWAKGAVITAPYFWRMNALCEFVYEEYYDEETLKGRWVMMVEDQTEIFNRLTNGGANEGVYLSNGHLYVNASMIQSGSLSGDRIQGGILTLGGSGNGSLEVFRLSNKCARLSGYGFWMGSNLPNSSSATETDYNNASTFRVNTLNGSVHGKDFNVITGSYKSRTGGTVAMNSNGFSIKNSRVDVEVLGYDWKEAYGEDEYDEVPGDVDYGYYPMNVYWPHHPQVGVRVNTHDAEGTGRWASLSTYGLFCDYWPQYGYPDSGKSLASQFTADGFKLSNKGNVTTLTNANCWAYATNTSRRLIVTNGGNKNKLYDTEDYGRRFFYCYETPTPYFGDIGDGVIGDDGFCYIMIDPIFSKTVKLDQYQVFLQAYGSGECYIYERKKDYFIVKGEPNLEFGWELKAKQADGGDQLRMDKDEPEIKRDETNYGIEAAMHLKEISIDYAEESVEHINEINRERGIA